MPSVEFKINYVRHAGQQEVIDGLSRSNADVILCDASRGWGKTLFVTCDIVVPLMLEMPNAQVLWVAPTYKICKAPIDDVWNGYDDQGRRYLPKIDEKTGFQFWDWKQADMEIHLFNGSKMFLRSATNPDSIVAKGYHLIVIDEAALIDKDTFMLQILPTARRAGCKIVLISTPRGRNWFWEFYLNGQDKSKPSYISFKQPWWKRPNYPEVLKRLMKDMPKHLREQEFDAEFIVEGAGAFKNLEAVFQGKSIQYPSDQQCWMREWKKEDLDKDNFVVAVDFAKTSDFTVIVAMGIDSREVYYYERMNKMDYKIVLEKVRKVSAMFNNADLIYDSTGVGKGLGDFLSGDLHSHPYNFTNDSKNEIINRLIVACDYASIKLPNIVTMRQEFELFTYTLSKTGKLVYAAPSGKHDDTVIAVALANWYCEQNSGKAAVEEVEDFLSVIEDVNRPRTRLEQLMEEDD